VVISDLREMDFGIFEGRSAKEMEQDEIYRAWVEGNCMGQIPEGENMDGFSRRTCDALTKLLNQALAAGEDTLVVVAHGGTQMAAMAEFVLPKKPYFQWLAPNGGGYLLDTAPWKETGKLTLVSKLAYAKGGKR
jgi:alpha-ribazole phosphatase